MKPYNEELRQQLADYAAAQKLSNADLARELGSNPTQINKYLNGKPEGDVERIENAIEDVLKSAERRETTAIKPFRTNVSDDVFSTLEQIRKTNDIGLIHGDAGVGKTVSIGMYQLAHPSSIMLNTYRWTRNERRLVANLFDAVETRKYKGKMTKAEFIAARLRNSNRLLIVDNAHKLTRNALEWLFDFHDDTDCPMALVGNPQVMGLIRANDQMFSRIGIVKDVKLARPREVARHMIAALAPGLEEDWLDMAQEVVSGPGHARALKKQILLASDLLLAPALAGRSKDAFSGAHQLLVRDYTL
jgi:DNA transposition AAA+ family ATPase